MTQGTCLLTDMVMPHMSGLEYYQKLKALIPELKVIFISGYPDEELRRYGLAEGNFPLLRKPFSQEELLQRIREVIESPTPSDSPDSPAQ